MRGQLKTSIIAAVGALVLLGGCDARHDPGPPAATAPRSSSQPAAPATEKFMVDRDELKRRLTPEQFHVTQEKGTERAFRNAFWNQKAAGAYRCIVCGETLFTSDSKFDSGCGWPSFTAPTDGAKVAEHADRSHGMVRTEVTCSKCGAHLGHVFDDGPAPAGLRYCINSASLDFAEAPTTKPARGE